MVIKKFSIFNFQFSNLKKEGFTLIELLVTTSIILILVTIGLISYNSFNEKQILVQASGELKNNIRLTQNKALTGEKVCGSSTCGGTDDICNGDETPLFGWQMVFNGSSYDTYGLCGINGLTKFNLKTYTLPQGITIEYPVSGTKMTFKAFPTGVLNPGAVYILSSFNKKYKFEVTGSGEIIDIGILNPGDPFYIPPVLPTSIPTSPPIPTSTPRPTSIPTSPPIPTSTPRPTAVPPPPLPTSTPCPPAQDCVVVCGQQPACQETICKADDGMCGKTWCYFYNCSPGCCRGQTCLRDWGWPCNSESDCCYGSCINNRCR